MLFRDFAPLDDSAEAAAALLGDIDAETLVKDYWVTETLRVISRNHGDCFVFKGGTSLTKAVRCVDRFSEDIDVLITDKPDGMSFDRLMKTMAADVTSATGLIGERVSGTTNLARAVSYEYPTRLAGRLRPEVLLEMGRRGTDLPEHIVYSIRPMLADVPMESVDTGDFADLDAFDVAVMHPARTLWEKVSLVHSDVVSGDWREHRDPSRFARHYGDIGALLNVSNVQEALADPEARQSLDLEVREISNKYFREVPAVPEGGYAASPAFRPEGEYLEFLTEHFDLAVETLWSPSSRPTLEGVLAAVAESSRLLDPCVDENSP